MSRTLNLEVFKGKEASVNSYIISNAQSMIVLDVLRNSAEAAELVEVLRSKNLPLTHILISHGHPDHYIGMDVVKNAFPEAEICVASEGVKQDIISFSTWMESVGWLEGEPTLKPLSEQNPQGFDYQNEIKVLDTAEFTLLGGGTLQIETDYPGAEAEHLTTFYSEELKAFFSSDFCYNGVHLWLGQGVDTAHIDNWRTTLAKFSTQFTDPELTIYPGHGAAASPQLFGEVSAYLDAFEQVIAAAENYEQAMTEMKTLYPTHEQADFLLHHSVSYHMSMK